MRSVGCAVALPKHNKEVTIASVAAVERPHRNARGEEND